MTRLSSKIKRQARNAIRMSVKDVDNSAPASPLRKMTSFPYTVGSLVSFRKSWCSWDGDRCEKGSLGLVMKGPYLEPSGTTYVDAIVSGHMIENIPAKLLMIQEMEEY